MDARTPTCAREILNKLHLKQIITWSHANECIVYVNWTIMHLKHDSEFLEGRGACVRPILHNWHFNQTCVIIRIESIGLIIHDTVISGLPNWCVCSVLRRTCFLLIDVIIYVIGICGYTKRSLIKSRFSWFIIYTTFIPILSKFSLICFGWDGSLALGRGFLLCLQVWITGTWCM